MACTMGVVMAGGGEEKSECSTEVGWLFKESVGGLTVVCSLPRGALPVPIINNLPRIQIHTLGTRPRSRRRIQSSLGLFCSLYDSRGTIPGE